MGDDAMRDNSRNESPRGLDQRGEGQDNNGAQNRNIFPRYSWLFAEAAGDVEWFEANPGRRHRLRPRVKGEWMGPHLLIYLGEDGGLTAHEVWDGTDSGVLCKFLLAELGSNEENFLSLLLFNLLIADGRECPIRKLIDSYVPVGHRGRQ